MVSRVCAGTMMWGTLNKEAPAEGPRPLRQEGMAHEQLDTLLELGVNFIDTAELPLGLSGSESGGRRGIPCPSKGARSRSSGSAAGWRRS